MTVQFPAVFCEYSENDQQDGVSWWILMGIVRWEDNGMHPDHSLPMDLETWQDFAGYSVSGQAVWWSQPLFCEWKSQFWVVRSQIRLIGDWGVGKSSVSRPLHQIGTAQTCLLSKLDGLIGTKTDKVNWVPNFFVPNPSSQLFELVTFNHPTCTSYPKEDGPRLGLPFPTTCWRWTPCTYASATVGFWRTVRWLTSMPEKHA